MDLKMLLRYQISGSVFIAWFLLFHYSVHSADFADMATKIMDISSLATLVMAIPLGAIIHQFSVTIKNQIFGLCEESYLSDSPMKKPTRAILNYYANNLTGDDSKEINLEYLKYIQEKITNLNSFYYMRFDNGFLAPLLASILFYCIDNVAITSVLVFGISLFIICVSLLYLYKYVETKPKIKKIIAVVAFISVIGVICYSVKSCTANNKNTTVDLLTISMTHTESNISYITTQDYSFESANNIKNESLIIADNLVNPSNISDINDDNIQKITIIESEDTSQISNIQQQQDRPLHIAKAEITKIDTTLLNKILIACLIISTLLLSYIPRIKKELDEYVNLIMNREKMLPETNQITNQNRINEDLSFADLSSRTIKNVNFTKSNLSNALFINSVIENCDFTDADLSRVNFSNSKIIQCEFTNTNISNATLLKTQVENSNFVNTTINVQDTNFHSLIVKTSRFLNAKFSNINLKNLIRREFSNVFDEQNKQ